MSKCTENSPIAFTDCSFCGARVEIRKSHRTGKAYWTCDGDHDVRACHSQVRLGPRPSRDLLDQRRRRASSEPPRPAPSAAGPKPPRVELRQPAPIAAPPPAAAAPPRPPAAPDRPQPAPPQPAPAEPDNPFDIMGNLFAWTRKPT